MVHRRPLDRFEVRLQAFHIFLSFILFADPHILFKAIQMSRWHADVYKHFEPVPDLVRLPDGNIGYSFKCHSDGYVHFARSPRPYTPLTRISLPRKLKCRSVVRSRNTTATSNLIDHARRCTGDKQKKKALKFLRDLLRLKVAQWCAKRGRPFAMVDDEEFGKLCFIFKAFCCRSVADLLRS